MVVLSVFFNWCVRRDLIPASPVAGVDKPGKTVQRDRVLSDSEVKAIWAGTAQASPAFGAMVKLLLLTGARRNEVAEMTWGELDLEARVWTIPGARTKNGETHKVHLSDTALDVLVSLPRFEACPYVVTTDGKTHVSGFSKLKDALDKAAGVASWHLHDTRRTAATGMARLGVSVATIEKALNHKSGTFRGIVSTYNQHDYLEETRAAFIAWGDYVARLVGAGDSNVLPLVRSS